MRITYTGVGLFWIWLFVNAFTLSAQEKLELSGKIRVLGGRGRLRCNYRGVAGIENSRAILRGGIMRGLCLFESGILP